MEDCTNYRQLVEALKKPTHSINIGAKVEAMMRCRKSCGELKEDCLQRARGETATRKQPAELPETVGDVR